jgi:hypothetical protein
LTVTPGPPAITNGLVVYLNFDSNIVAQAGTTNNGTPIGAVGAPRYTNGVIGAAALFENDPNGSGSTDWAISLGDIESIYSNNWSFSLWVNTTDTLGAQLGNKDWNSGGNIGWLISEYYTDFLNYRAQDATRHDIGNFNWADGLWHQVAAVFYRDANVVYTYVDGALTAQAGLGLTGLESLTPADIMPNATLVGSSGNANYSGYGAIDDLGIWTRPLPAADVMAIHQAGLAGRGLTEVTRQQPSLNIALSGTNVVITYPASAASYTLQFTLNVSPASWQSVGLAPAISNDTATVKVPINKLTEYFRLQQ